MSQPVSHPYISSLRVKVSQPVNQDATYLTIIGYDEVKKKSYVRVADGWLEFQGYDMLPQDPAYCFAGVTGDLLKQALMNGGQTVATSVELRS